MPNPDLIRSMRSHIVDAVDKHDQPGVFTAFHFEWTSSPDARNLHRNVIFRNGKDKAMQSIPLLNYDTADPEELWKWMADYEEKTGGRALAIPHNGNPSNGAMFDVETRSGKPIDAAYAKSRMRWEPIYEVPQIKGDGEAYPLLSPNYESADYYNRDKGDSGYIGIQPARVGERLNHDDHATGIHHIALWARNRKEVKNFYKEFLVKEGVIVTDIPNEYPAYAPGYYAVFFVDPTGIRWELAYTPRIPMPWDILKTLKVARELRKEHPQWKHSPAKEMMRKLPTRDEPA